MVDNDDDDAHDVDVCNAKEEAIAAYMRLRYNNVGGYNYNGLSFDGGYVDMEERRTTDGLVVAVEVHFGFLHPGFLLISSSWYVHT